MLKKEKQKRYFEKRCEVIINCLNDFCRFKNAEDLHTLRVEIKKIKALATLAERCNKNPGIKKTPAYFKKIFRHAALIRTAHLNVKFIAKHTILNATFKKEQTKIIETQSALFCSSIDTYFALVKEFKKTLPENLRNIKNDQILKEYKKQIKKLTEQFENRLPEKEMHTTRKRIKRMLFAYRALNIAVKNKLNLNETYLDKMQNSMGKWHDTIMELKILQAHSIQNVRIKNEVEKQKEKYARLIQAASKNFSTKIYKVK